MLAAHEDDLSPWIAEAAFRISHTWGRPRPASKVDQRLGVEALEENLARFPVHQRAAQTHVDIAIDWLTQAHPDKAALWLNRLLTDARYQTRSERFLLSGGSRKAQSLDAKTEGKRRAVRTSPNRD